MPSSQFFDSEKKIKPAFLQELIVYPILFLLSYWVLTESPLSPSGNKIPLTDSGVYMFMAKQIMNGKIMYKDLFDHKGPVIYLINILGLAITPGSFSGVWTIELISLFTTSMFFYKTVRIFTHLINSLGCTCIMLLALVPLLEQGNLTEEYALLFSTVSLYYFALLLYKKQQLHTIQVIVVCICFCFSFLLRPNLTTLWISFAPITLFILIKEKRKEELFKYSKTVLLCISTVFIILYLYLALNDAAKDFYEAFWVFNKRYAKLSLEALQTGMRTTFNNLEYLHFPVLILLFFIFIAKRFFHQQTVSSFYIGLIFYGAASIIFSCALSGNPYLHYDMAILPFLVCIGISFKNLPKVLSFISFFILLSPLAQKAANEIPVIRQYTQADEFRTRNLVRFIQQNTVDSETISIIGNDAKIYLLSGRGSCSKFYYQTPIADIDPKIANAYINDLIRTKPAIIVIQQPYMLETTLSENNLLAEFFSKNYTQRLISEQLVFVRN